ncbi:MAG: type I methionyl aminopeptidase [Proteobacteria bacterium]|nr:type I methionyl aminopeptidase [Desulfobulbaceae bacterium]MBU4152883.1 type I methionyl aminopeptidase [Pseudomonadota bacterium]
MSSAVTIKTVSEIDLMRRANQIVAQALNLIINNIKIGVTTKELDIIAEDYAKKNGAIPAFKGYRGFPASICSSINEQVVHGIPSNKVILQEGDLVSIDFGVKYKGFYGDAAFSIVVGENTPEKNHLLKVTQKSLYMGIEQARKGNRVSDISLAIQTYVEDNKLYVVKQFVGHGIGSKLHEPPEVPNYKRSGSSQRLIPGMVLAIEPMVNVGTSDVQVLKDGWTVITSDKTLSAHFEHSVLITDGNPEILSEGIIL